MGLQSIVNRGDLLRKVHFPTYIIVASVTMGSMISLAINLGVVIVFGLFTTAHFTWRILLVPLNVFQLYILALGIAMILSTMFVYYRDIAHIWEVVLQAMFYAVPIIYPLSMVQKNYPLLQNSCCWIPQPRSSWTCVIISFLLRMCPLFGPCTAISCSLSFLCY